MLQPVPLALYLYCAYASLFLDLSLLYDCPEGQVRFWWLETAGIRLQMLEQVTSVAPSLDGQWLATASDDGSVRLWEVATGRCLKTIQFESKARCCAWCPDPNSSIISVTAGSSLYLLYTGRKVIQRSLRVESMTQDML